MARLNGKRCVDLHGKVCTLFEKTFAWESMYSF